MNGVEWIPEKLRQGYAAQSSHDRGEDEPQSFEDDGHGYCLHCRRSIVFHREAAFCTIGTQ